MISTRSQSRAEYERGEKPRRSTHTSISADPSRLRSSVAVAGGSPSSASFWKR
jgi:hypothetical protein